MSDKPDIGARLELDTSAYTRSVQQGIRASQDFDDALTSLTDEANKAEKQLKDMSGKVDMKIDADFSSLLQADTMLQSLDTTITPLVDISVVNETAARGLLEEFNTTLTSKINVEDSELKDAQQLLAKLDSETVDTKINADTSELKGIREQLETLQKLAVIDIILNLPETLPGIDDIPLLGAIADQDKARRTIAAGTGGNDALTNQYAAGAEDVFASNFGADREEAARGYMDVVRQTKDETGELATTGENFGKITKDAFATAAQTGEDFNSVLAAADTLVQTGLVPSYTEAFDLINTGFQEGLNKGDDFLDTIKEYSGQFKDLGFSAEEFVSTLKGGLEAGAFNTDFVADLVKEFNIRAQAAATKGGTEFDYFKAIGMSDEVKAFNAGELSGKEFFSGVVKATASGDFNPQQIFDVLGTKAEDLTLDAVIQLDPEQIDKELAKYRGSTLDVSAALGGDLNSSIETARRKIESELAASVSTAFDIPGKIQQFSDGVSEMSRLIDMGATIPEAIEVAFQLPGFAEGVDILASTMGNLGITFMELVASILDALGQGGAAGGVRDTIAQAGEAQLAFDLKLADDGSDFANAIRAAVNRGVEAADIQKGILTAGTELIAQGDMTAAQEYLAVIQDMATIEMSPGMVSFLSGKGIDPTNLQAVSTELSNLKPDLIDFSGIDYQGLFKEAQTSILPEIDFAAEAQTALGPLQTEFTNAQNTVDESLAAMRASAEAKLPGLSEVFSSSMVPVSEQTMTVVSGFNELDAALALLGTTSGVNTALLATNLTNANSDVDSFATNADTQFTDTFGAAVDGAGLVIENFGIEFTTVMLGASKDVDDFIAKLLSIGTVDVGVPVPGVGGGEGGGEIPGKAAGGIIPQGSMAEVHHGELAAYGDDISILNRQTSSILDSAIAAYLSSAGAGGGGSTVYNTFNNNFNFNNNGAAAANGSMNATKTIRGF